MVQMLFTCSSQPWSSPLSTVSLISQCKSLKDANKLYARLITTGLIKNSSITKKLILNLCSSNNSSLIEFARHVFLSNRAIETYMDPFLWNVIIKTFSHGVEDPREAVNIFSLMVHHGVYFDKYSLSLVLKACTRVGLLKEGMQIHALSKKLGISEFYVHNCLISLYLRCHHVEYARLVFDTMPQRDPVSHNLMIDGYADYGMVDRARDIFECMSKKDRNLISWNSMMKGYMKSLDGLVIAFQLFEEMPKRDLFSWNLIIDGYAKHGKMNAARDLFDQMTIKDMSTWTTMIDGYAKSGNVDVARELFEQMQPKDIIAFNAMTSGYVQNGHHREALDLYRNLSNVYKLVPDRTTLLISVCACAQLGKIDEGIGIHCYIRGKKFDYEDKLGVALIDMYAKCGSIYDALDVFGSLKKKTIDHWNAMIGGFAIHGMGAKAFQYLMEMKRVQINPDDITFIGVLNACAHNGLIKEGLICFDLMRNVYRIEPKLQHYGCMVDILGRAGQIKQARRFIEAMPIEPNNIIWRTLLGHCKNHDDLSIGEPIAEHLMTLDSSYPGTYVLLSNIYAGCGIWNGKKRVRSMMKERNLKKVQGCSTIELMGVEYEFSVKSTSQILSDDIYRILNNLYALS